MAKITHLQMWKDICGDDHIVVIKSFLGLRTTAVYQPTNSPLNATKMEFSLADGDKLRRILSSPADNLANAVGDFRPKQTANGNYMAEVCTSQDGAFIAVRLYQFINMNYEPVIGTCRFEGEKAQIIKRLF